MSDTIRIFVGYDPREAVAYHVCCESIIANCSEPNRLSFHPVTGVMRDGSNTFTYGRFEVPARCGYKGFAIWLDGDMVVRSDILELAQMQRLDMGVQCVQHDYQTKHPVKYLGARNADYPRKNWSSVILWNCGFFPNRKLTPAFVETRPGSYLHRFGWLSDQQIGALPAAWNRLVSEQPVTADDKILHYTIGTPCFEGYENQEGSAEWYRHLAGALNVAGQSPVPLMDNLLHHGRMDMAARAAVGRTGTED